MKLRTFCMMMILSVAALFGGLSANNVEAADPCVEVRAEKAYGGKIAVSMQKLCVEMDGNRIEVVGHSDGENWRGRPFKYDPDVVQIVAYRDATSEKYPGGPYSGVCDEDECYLDSQTIRHSKYLNYQCRNDESDIRVFVVYKPTQRSVKVYPDTKGDDSFLTQWNMGIPLSVSCH